MGHHRAVAHRAVERSKRLGAHQADARQQRGGRLGLFARRLPDRRRPGWRGGLCGPPRPGLVARDPAGERHGPQPHGHRLALGHRASRVVPVRPEPPYPGYTFDGAGPLDDDRVGIVLEDHYWDDSGRRGRVQAVRPRDRRGRYIYHGNDGTSFPWNDTAQLDFLDADGPRAGHPDDPRRRPALPDHPLRCRDGPRQEARPAALVAAARRRATRSRRAPSTPSRKAEFDARMPVEFWREVVDRVAAEVPGTLLLAEAFWMLEGYFVRTLGHAPRLQQRVHAHAPRRGRRGLPEGHPRDPRIRSRRS